MILPDGGLTFGFFHRLKQDCCEWNLCDIFRRLRLLSLDPSDIALVQYLSCSIQSFHLSISEKSFVSTPYGVCLCGFLAFPSTLGIWLLHSYVDSQPNCQQP